MKSAAASLVSFALLSAFTAVITDTGLGEAYRTEFTLAGIPVFLAEVS